VRTGTRAVLAVITAARRLDLRLVGEAVGDSHVRLAAEEELSRDVEGYELGAPPPLGALATTCTDPEVLRRDSGGCGWRAGGELFGEVGGTPPGTRCVLPPTAGVEGFRGQPPVEAARQVAATSGRPCQAGVAMTFCPAVRTPLQTGWASGCPALGAVHPVRRLCCPREAVRNRCGRPGRWVVPAQRGRTSLRRALSLAQLL
jgi:hypothetical protein